VEVPLNNSIQPPKPIISLNDRSQDHTNHHREVLKKALDTIEILQDISSLSIQEGAWEMVKLAIQLYELQMFVEAATIGVWYHLDTDNLDQEPTCLHDRSKNQDFCHGWNRDGMWQMLFRELPLTFA